jgi:uncharacterized repeat protein (TIGR01451 family)
MMIHLPRSLSSRAFFPASLHRFLSLIAAVAILVAVAPQALATSSTIVISQVYGGGGNTGATLKNDFIGLYNLGGSTVNVSGWSVQYAATTGSSWQRTNLSGSIAPGHYYLVQEAAGAGGSVNLPTPDATGSISMAAGAGKVALVNNQTTITSGTVCPSGATIVDFVGYGTGTNCFEGGPTATLTNTTAALRNGNGCTDTDNNGSDFSTGAPNPRNSASTASFCGGPTNPTGVGLANPSSVDPGGTTLLTVTVTPGTNPPSSGITVTGNLGAIGGSTAQTFYDDGTTGGDLIASDNVFSYSATVAVGTTSGNKNLPFTVADNFPRSSTGSIALTVNPPVIAIHDIQGSGSTSPHVGELVATIGVVTGVKSNGFFIQSKISFEDGDPNTSEGVFVFTSSAPPVGAAVGNEVKVAGTVQEFIPSADVHSPPTTEIGGSPTLSVLSTGNPLPAPITLTALDTSPTGSIEQLEKYEGMRVHVDSLTVIAPTQGTVDENDATSTSNGVFYGVITGVARPFREPGIQTPDPLPPGSPCCVPTFDANPERLRVDSDGLTGSTRIEVTTGAVVTNLTGPLDYAFRTYTIDPEPATVPVVTGNISAIPVPAPASNEFTVSSFNMERFFDTTNDPGISDVALTSTAFDNRLNKVSLAIRNVLLYPDILGVEEVENLTTLQAVAAKVNLDAVAAGDPNPNYQAYLEEGNDIGGIDVGFLVKGAPRVAVIDVTQEGKDTTYIDPNNGQPALLNDRPSLVMRATITEPGHSPFPVTVIVNHLRSLSGVDDPADGDRVRTKRRAQAEFLANLIQGRQSADPDEHIVLVGDFNAFEVNDGYVDTIGTIIGTPTPCDQVVLCSADLVDPDLMDLASTVPASDRYSYSFDGNAQVLDHELMTQNLLVRFDGLHYARNDADFPESFRNDSDRPERISDHDMPVAYFNIPPEANLSITKGDAPDPVTTGATLTYTLTVSNSGPDVAASVTVTDNLPSDVAFVSCSSTGSGACGGSGNARTVSFASLASGGTETITLTATVVCTVADGTAVSNTATVGSDTIDPDTSDNSSTTTTGASNPAPTVTAPAVDKTTLWPSNHQMVLVTVSYEVSDNCGGTACGLSVASNEPVNGLGDGDTAPDWQIVDAHHVMLRAERSGTGSGRIYTISVTCTDSAGRPKVRTVNVTVPKSQK